MNAEHEKDMDLIARYLAGVASADEVRSLEQRLQSDAVLRRSFLSHANVDATLQASVRPAMRATAPVKAAPARWRKPMMWAAAAALLLLATLNFWSASDGVDARVLAVSGATGSEWKVNDALKLRDLSLAEGSMQLGLSNGVALDLVAPVRMRFADAMHATLLAGSVTADVGNLGKGFVIETSSARVVDLGTRFGVSLGSTGETDVAVFQGKVEVFGKAQPKQLASLTAGEAVRVHPSATARRLVCINTRGESFATLTPPPRDALVTNVTDNVDDGGSYAFYTLQTGQMRPGARPYSTLGRPRWQAMPGEAFPAELIDADVVGTFSPDRHDPDLELTLSVSRACTVYLMFDARAEVPEWVRRDFVEAGFQLRSGPWADNPVVQGMTADDSGAIHVNYKVWKRSVPSAGVVKLGPPYPEKDGKHRAMYGIAVK